MNWDALQTSLVAHPQAHLLLVTKGHSPEKIQRFYELGQRHFGENYVQEAIEKQKRFDDSVCWHFIGKIQSNKIKLMARHFDWVQSVITKKQAEMLSQAADQCRRQLNICLMYQSEGRDGVNDEALMTLAKSIEALPALTLRGLMVLPSAGLSEAAIRSDFHKAALAYHLLKSHFGGQINTLSMGMSADYALALAEGSTQIRIGRGLLGERHEQSK